MLWDDDSMKQVMEAVKGGLHILRDHLSGRIEHGIKSGPEQPLSC